MSTRTFDEKQLTRLYHDVRRATSKPEGPHLSDRNKRLYALEELAAEDVEKLDRHLISCEACCQDVKGLLANAATATAPVAATVARQHASKLRKRFGALWGALTAAFAPIPLSFAQPALRTSSQVLFKGRTSDGTLSWRALRTPDGSLHFMLGSSASALKGATIVLKQGRFECPVEVKSVGKKMGAEIVISRSDWQRLSPGPLLHRVILKDGAVITTDDFHK